MRATILKIHLVLLCSSFGAALSAPASAQVTASFSGGVGGIQGGETLFADFSAGSMGGVTGLNFITQTGSNSVGADPAVGGQGDLYLSVLKGGYADFKFAGLSRLGLDYGSADWYNSFTLSLSNGATRMFTGEQVLSLPPANGDQGASRTNGRLTFIPDAGLSITGLRLSSSDYSLEIDNMGTISAVPEPTTWAMMLFGFGAVGFSMRRRATMQIRKVAA